MMHLIPIDITNEKQTKELESEATSSARSVNEPRQQLLLYCHVRKIYMHVPEFTVTLIEHHPCGWAGGTPGYYGLTMGEIACIFRVRWYDKTGNRSGGLVEVWRLMKS